jgi:hypothetical protein
MQKTEDLLSADDRQALHDYLQTETPTGRKLQAWLAGRGIRICRAAACGVRARLLFDGTPPKARLMLKVDEVLKPEDREPYAAFCRAPGTTNRTAQQWLLARGYRVSYGAVHRHRRRTTRQIMEVRRSAELAVELGRIARAAGSAVIGDAALTRFEQVVMEQLCRTSLTKRLSPKDLSDLGRSVGTAVTARSRMEELRREFDKQKRAALRAAERAANKRGATPRDVALRMREILGV